MHHADRLPAEFRFLTASQHFGAPHFVHVGPQCRCLGSGSCALGRSLGQIGLDMGESRFCNIYVGVRSGRSLGQDNGLGIARRKCGSGLGYSAGVDLVGHERVSVCMCRAGFPGRHGQVSVPGMNPKLIMSVLGPQLFSPQSAKQQTRFCMSI